MRLCQGPARFCNIAIYGVGLIRLMYLYAIPAAVPCNILKQLCGDCLTIVASTDNRTQANRLGGA